MLSYRTVARAFYASFPEIIWHGPRDDDAIYLTFDDGPYPAVTAPLLEYLHGENVAATFFLSGEAVFRYRHELGGLPYQPHALGSHMYHHQPLIGMRRTRLLRELNVSDELIVRYLNRLTHLFRPPYGIFNRKIFPVLQSAAKQMVMWSLMAYDFRWESDRVLDHLFSNARAGDIIVFHDSPRTEKVLMEVVPEFVSYCRTRGWEPRTVEARAMAPPAAN